MNSVIGTEGTVPFFGVPFQETDQNKEVLGNKSLGVNLFGEIPIYRNEFYFEQDVGYYDWAQIVKFPGEKFVQSSVVTYNPNRYLIRTAEAVTWTSSVKGKTPDLFGDFRFSAVFGFRMGYVVSWKEIEELYIYQNEAAEEADNETFVSSRVTEDGVGDGDTPLILQMIYGLGVEYQLPRYGVNILVDVRFGFDFSTAFFRPIRDDDRDGVFFENVLDIQFGASYRAFK